MEIDRSFCIKDELEMFLARCPKLASLSQFHYLKNQGDMLTEEELINGVVQLFLHPRYTIPLVGCFRPIARKIVDRAVALLRLVPDLTSNSEDSMVEFDEDRLFKEAEDPEIVCVIDFYVGGGRGLDLHEVSCLAFSRALDLVPFLLGSVLYYFEFAPPPFKRIVEKDSVAKPSFLAGSQLLSLRVSYRLLLAEPEVFNRQWDWSCILVFVQQLTHRYGEDMKFLMTGLDIRWCATQILSVIMRISDRVTSNMIQRAIVDSGIGAEEAFSCLLRWQEFLQDVSLEKAGWYLESSGVEKSDSFGEKMDSNEVHNLQSFGMAVTSSVFLESNPSSKARELIVKGKPFVLTSVVKKSFEMVQLAVSQRWPVLLYGQAGTGKTALINRLAQNHGSRVLSIHMDEQTDGKTLIGSYVCAEQPGEFKWQPGSLTQAVTSGLWVVLEDIDKAPADVQSILLPLLEGATSFLTGNGEVIRVNEGFRLFSTVSCLRLDTSSATSGRNSLSTLWRRVMVWSPSSEDLLNIVEAWYPELKDLAGKLIVTYERVNQLAAAQLGTSVSFTSASRFSLRDILKWCKRIVHLVFHGDGNAHSAKILHGLIYQEAIDVFATFSSSVTTRKTIMTEIAKIWGIQNLDPVDKPVIKEMRSDLQIGRIFLQRTRMTFSPEKKNFVELCNSVCLLERIAASVKCNEPVLLVGETGTGKTTLVQNLATRLGQRLTILNLSQQSDVADLLGGFKPMNVQFVCLPLYKEFESLFSSTFSLKDNEGFLATLRKCVTDKNWNLLFTGFQMGVRKVIEIGKGESGLKRKRPLSEELLTAWEVFSLKLERARLQIINSDGMVFSFVEGAFVTALKNGDWILLDEINLAPPETLQRVIGVLEEESGSLCLAERGDVNYICRHPNFRIFACMNPATDAGKRDLSFSVRSRFTEYFVDDVLEDEDLFLFVNQIMDGNHSDKELTSKLVRFYKAARKESEEKLQDSANQKPQYSLRSLHRALTYTIKASRKFGFQKALYDGFCMFFLVLLDVPSAKLMNQLILKLLLAGIVPPQVPFDKYLEFKKQISGDFLDDYVLTRSVKGHLTNLARAIFVCNSPVLLQGPTSSGKTSLVRYLALITGHEFVRINNHEHTDLQEYLGSYITDASGKLVFQEGVLVKAVRHGYWIVLDELNLAPSDVLEALNRLLDDNRELYIPELCETIRAHSKFMLFATQNPPTFYGGRKMLSRAFRNRFVEIHVDEIPDDELCTILEIRCKIPNSYAKKMVDVLKELQLRRQISKVFAGKHGFITPRDLFRWAYRFRTFGKSYEDLARDGYYLLAERLRDDVEKKVVQDVLETQLRIKLSTDDMYKQGLEEDRMVLSSENLGKITWTDSMRRLYFLVERCYRLREPVLLVGETGGGKTTVCQLLNLAVGSKMHILNCHQYTETSDFLGGFYPIRERSGLSSEFRILCEQLMQSKTFKHLLGETTISLDINQASVVIEQVTSVINSLDSHPEATRKELSFLEETKMKLVHLHQMWHTIFTWQDGPLVQAMKNGDLFLVDEISLADDSVLERLNSVLEPERKLSLAERGGSTLEEVTAHPNFFLLATMNPGGDFGKKELSPALRNRFTEIWVPPVDDLNELKSIALEKTLNRNIVDPMIKFWKWFNELQTGRMLTVRDLLSWIAFINDTVSSLQPEVAFLHGAFLVLLDGLSLGTSFSKHEVEDLRKKCFSNLLEQLKENKFSLNESNHLAIENYSGADPVRHEDTFSVSMGNDGHFGIHPFYIKRGDDFVEAVGFEFLAPTTRKNALRVLRAMQLAKPVLLEGSPGVGKTSLIVALGKFSGHSVVRINLSEQTDIMDLLGSDLPVESDEGMQFAWSDGILLQALKKGSWVLLDELNLAPQSVLEGLNAILDHRGEVFIPELGLTFKCPSSFRIFACQNPTYQGGGRKGLPKSFLNRFTKVYVDELVERDYLFICTSLYPSIPQSLLSKLISFNTCLHEYTMVHHKFGLDGSPWEFNLRDVIRSCQIIEGAPDNSKFDCFLNAVYVQRMRTPADRQEVVQLYEKVFGLKPFISPYPRVQLSPQCLIVGNTCIKRSNYVQPSIVSSSSQLKILPGMRNNLEAVAQCVKYQWLILLIGPPSSGKTSLIRLLAQLSGNVLNELNLSSATDTSELLGCFEQYNDIRTYRFVIDRVERYMSEYCAIQMESSSEEFMKRKDLISRWLAFLSSTDYRSSLSSISAYDENWRTRSFGSISLLVEIIEHIRLHLEKDILPTDLDRMLKTIRKLQDDHAKSRSSVKFEWVTGSLIKAIENGEWIILENANLCNPTVLDRINSLVEQSGSITINECGTVDGQPVVLRPHDQFRMFFTVNPSYGEVSRAMRNRGVEIYMMQPYWLLSETFDQTDFTDVKRFLVLSGVPGERLVHLMAKAHIYSRREGAHLGVSITNLELARWVQLFQRLITSGNQPLWSLQISWEHTYLSSLGEVEGKSIVDHALLSFLSMAKLNKFKSYVDCSLCLPGGWPAPLKLNDFVRYSKETSVKQNCMYLESLGAQLASRTFCIASERCRLEYNLIAGSSPMTHLIDLKMLREVMFPEASNVMVNDGTTIYDSALANKRLLFAANWAIEQATESDLDMYLLWFDWFGSRLKLFCPFFYSFSNSLKEERKHSIWTSVLHCRQELKAHSTMELESIPILSLELANLTASKSESYGKLLKNAIDCVGLLRHSYLQWSAESEFNFSAKNVSFKPLLQSLRKLEDKVLDILPKSASFDVLFRLYKNLLEDHILFWNGLVSEEFECLLIAWRSLGKDAVKLFEYCRSEVENFQEERKALNTPFWSFHSQKSLLWLYGGHPFLPSSADIYRKQQQLLNLCESIWSVKMILQELAADGSSIGLAVSSNPELRILAMQGFCLSECIMSEVEDDLHVIQQLEDMFQKLLIKFNHEKDKLQKNLGANCEAYLLEDSSCALSPDMLCRSSCLMIDTVPLNDHTSFYLDMRLLLVLSKVVMLDGAEVRSAISRSSGLLQPAMEFSLTFSSRPPADFSPHQKILWIHEAWASINDANAKFSSCVLEMWFRWHTSLWNHHLGIENPMGPDMLFQPVKTATLDKILKSSFLVRDYSVHSLKLRVASNNLWQSSSQVADSHSFLLFAARYLFQQIILAHKKSFEADTYSSMKSIFSSIQEKSDAQDDVNDMMPMLKTTKHNVLESCISPQIEPLLNELYIQRSSTDSLHDLGCAWLRIGGLRYTLLIRCDDIDPVVKNSLKHNVLTDKINLLQLEIEVQSECVRLAGCVPSLDADKKRKQLLEDLKTDRKRLRRQIVFRSGPEKFKKLKNECGDASKDLVGTSLSLQEEIESLNNMEEMSNKLHHWQEKATAFIERLSEEYSGYVDIIQPVQVAIYEMKLGLSLVHLSALRKQLLNKVKQDNIDLVLGTIYSFMRFPRCCRLETAFISDGWKTEVSPSEIDFHTNIEELDLNLLENLVTSASDANTDKSVCNSVLQFFPFEAQVSDMQLKAAIHHNILFRVVQSIAEVHLVDNASFKLLVKIFNEFANLWMRMKVRVKTKAEIDARQYKFRPRAFKMEHVIEVNISTLGISGDSDTFSEWQELVSEAESTEANKGGGVYEALDEDWNVMHESFLNDVVNIHNILFGSIDLLQDPGSVQVSDFDRLRSFMDSYELGIRMIKDLDGLLAAGLDAKLLPEHVLRVCLEHELKFNSSRKPAKSYNFYKDPNASLMAKMVEPLRSLQKKICALQSERDNLGPGLQKIVDVIDMLLSIPLGTPLAKALSGLHFLINRVWLLQETVSKFSISDQLDPILGLVSSWQKLEFESWPALLDEVQARFNINACQLWFPLYSVLQHRNSAETNEDSQSTIQSLEDFMQTSNIGEFRKRLELLLAFHGQISTAINQRSYSSGFHEDNLKILYNTFGFYVQFLPIIVEHLSSSRKSIEVELNGLLKLCRWERSERYLTMENSKRTRQKFRQLIQKYSDVLEQPVVLILNALAQRGIRTLGGHVPNCLSEYFERNNRVLGFLSNQSQFRDKERSIQSGSWRYKVDLAFQNLNLQTTAGFDFPYLFLKNAEGPPSFEGIKSIISKCISSQSSPCVSQERHTIEEIGNFLVGCGEVWKSEKKSLRKRRQLSGLLKLLDDCGLSKHKSTFLEDQFRTNGPSRWFLQPSYVVQHLLMTEGRMSSMDLDVAALERVHDLPQEKIDSEWKTANEYFFKSIAAVGHLRQICLNFHKDFTLEQVNRSVSYLDHLIEIQQEQREAVYGFAESLECLKKCSSPLDNIFSGSLQTGADDIEYSFSDNQTIVFKSMWQQKELFDDLCSTLHQECLLLETVENSHSRNCQSIGASSCRMRLSLQKFIPDCNKSKDLLNVYLLGRAGIQVTANVSLRPYGITKQMEDVVQQNFLLLRKLKEHIFALHNQDENRESVKDRGIEDNLVKDVLYGRIEEILAKGDLIAENFSSALKPKNPANTEDPFHLGRPISEIEPGFVDAFNETCGHIFTALLKVGSSNSHGSSEESSGNISVWRALFDSEVANLQLKSLCDKLDKTIHSAGEVVNRHGNRRPNLCLVVEANLKHLYSLLDLILTFSNRLLCDFLILHRNVSIITHVLANIFASLFSQGFGVSTEDESDESGLDRSRDASGTGMGEGVGVKDVSEQINDEDQLIGIADKLTDEQDNSTNTPNENDKGIEMEQDFDGDTHSVGEESGDDEDDAGEDEQLDSAMGETGPNSEILDEKLWDKDDDSNQENPRNKHENYESGPSVKDDDLSSRELRGKEDNSTATDETGALDTNDSNQHDDENGNDGSDDDVEDMNIDKDEAFSESTGLKLDEPDKGTDEDIVMDEAENVDDQMEDDEGTSQEGNDESPVHNNEGEDEGKTNSLDGGLDEAEPEQLTNNSDLDSYQKNNTDTDMLPPRRDSTEAVTADFGNDYNLSNGESATKPKGGSQAAALRDIPPEANWSNSNENGNDLAPVRGLPNESENEIAVSDSSKSGKQNDDKSNQLPQLEPSSSLKKEPNPFRSIGDALNGWKEKVNVSLDFEEEKNEGVLDELVDENAADEYGFTTGLDKGTDQALGTASADQIDRNIEGKEPMDGDSGTADQAADIAQMDIEKEHVEPQPIKGHAINLQNKKVTELLEVLQEEPYESPSEIYSPHRGNVTDSLLSIERSYMNNDIHKFGKLSVSDEDLGRAHNLEGLSSDMKDNSTSLWRKYELLTTRLSQELAEQLRLVMEPTLASKLQGDYKTGKRINMKMVIPFIASHYRRDKIWLRRTRPNKRNYQVVIAIDDSRSMSESHCGDVAIEALVTVCRAMSQLEVGSFAVASFGKKGNIRLLHDFDQPFNGEAGVKMLSSLTFTQENTIADEPVVDLLKYLNNLLDTAVTNARLPSGHNPLQQLVLIIADGRFHEKENLKRYVRDLLSKKCMVAFLLLDSPQESIMDLTEASFQGGNVKFGKYMDSFPFPFYVVLRNIEALPHTLANLLRQWFELMQSSRE